jgi:TolB-like protein/Flp pilus assembly protein TadD
MSALGRGGIFLFEGFRLGRDAGALLRRCDDDTFAPMAVGSRALDVLGVLVGRAGDLVSRDEFMAAVWPATVVEDINLNMQIAALRRVLDDGRANGSCIQTIAGRGYRFVVPVTRIEPDTRPASRLSIVVLPFANLSNDPEQQYFADAITEDLTTDLSRLADMQVISCNTAFTYRNRPIDTKQIGRELGVRYVLEGSIRRSGNQVRVTPQLIDAEADTHIWAERFYGDAGDLFALQDEITSRIAVALDLELIGVEAGRPAGHPDALDYILRGRAANLKPSSRDSRTEAISMFERALALDPRSVEAKSLLATALMGRVLDNMSYSAATEIAHAEELVGQVLAASPRNPLAHYAKGQVLRAQNQYQEAIPEYETAIAFNRNWVRAIAILGLCKFYTGSIEEMIPAQEQAIRLSPRDPVISIFYHRIGIVHQLRSRTDEAIHWLEKARNANPIHPLIRGVLASAYALNGETERAAAELAEARRLSGDNRFSSVARLKATAYWGVPSLRALIETTYLAGLRKAGMPEE